MKLRFVGILIFFVCTVSAGYGESFTSLIAGGGLATANNYDIGLSYGFSYYKGIRNKLAIGFEFLDQNYSLYRDKEINNVVGGTVSLKGDYMFFSPMVVVQLNRTGSIHGYVNAGIGIHGAGYTTLHTWDHTPWPSTVAYDSVDDKEKDDFLQLTYRIGIGLVEYCNVRGKLHIFFGQDVGILPMSFQNKNENDSDPTEFRNFKGSMDEFFRPTYISFRMGITFISHSHNTQYDGAIYR
jgi:hypothetical protein